MVRAHDTLFLPYPHPQARDVSVRMQNPGNPGPENHRGAYGCGEARIPALCHVRLRTPRLVADRIEIDKVCKHTWRRQFVICLGAQEFCGRAVPLPHLRITDGPISKIYGIKRYGSAAPPM